MKGARKDVKVAMSRARFLFGVCLSFIDNDRQIHSKMADEKKDSFPSEVAESIADLSQNVKNIN
jgi:hypothetical protein